jgi:hypothetical protein
MTRTRTCECIAMFCFEVGLGHGRSYGTLYRTKVCQSGVSLGILNVFYFFLNSRQFPVFVPIPNAMPISLLIFSASLQSKSRCACTRPLRSLRISGYVFAWRFLFFGYLFSSFANLPLSYLYCTMRKYVYISRVHSGTKLTHETSVN